MGTLAPRLRLYAITPPGQQTMAELTTAVGIGLRAGVTAIQYRDKSARPHEDRLRVARALRDLCRRHGALFIVNDDPELCDAVDADGVHVGPDDLPVAAVRARLGPHRIVGASAGTPERARALMEEGAGYLGVGAIFEARASKPDASAARGLDALRLVREAVGTLPLVAIGGITPANAAACLSAGADGVAAIRGLLGERDIASAAAAFRRALDSASA